MKIKLRKLSILLFTLAIYTHAFSQCETLVWEDNFDGVGNVDANGLNMDNWNYETGDGCPEICQWGTGQLDYSTDRRENVSVEGGFLNLTIRKETNTSEFNGRDYTSGRIRTYQKIDFKYGRIEARLKGVYSQGMGFAFWLLGSDFETVSWPKCGEVDIFEQTGKWPDYNIGTTHFEEAWGHAMNQGNITLPDGQRFADEFHTVGLIWTPDSMSWYMDDPSNIYHTFYYSNGINNYDPFNRDFFIILSVGMGGDYSGDPDGTTVVPQSAVVDYVKVWEGPYNVELKGSKKLYENTTSSYTISEVAGASYNWSVPAGASIVSGQNSNTIEVLWGGPESSGEITCNVQACFTQTYSTSVVVEPTIVVDRIFDDAESNRNVTYTEFSGSLETSVANPAPSDVNSSSTVVRHGRDGGTEWDYVVLEQFDPGHAGKYVQGTNRLFLDVYTNAPAGTRITLGFEDSDVAVPEAIYGKHSNYEAVTKTQNEWETLEFNLTGIPWQYTGAYNVDKAVLMFDPGVVNANTFYFDNFRSGVPGGEAPILFTNILEDWDGNSNMAFENATGNYIPNVANPNPSEVNNSGSVLSYTRNAGTEYDEIAYAVSFEDASLFKKGVNTISFDLYTGATPGKIVSMHLVDTTQNIVDWQSQIHSIYEAKITKQNEWEHVVFNWSSTPNAAVPNVNVNKLVFKIDENFTTGDTYYIDNIQVNSTEAEKSYIVSQILEDYEANRNLTYTYSGDPYEENIQNPAPSEVNPSAIVGYYNRGYNLNDWLVYDINVPIEANKLRAEESVFLADIYTDAPSGTIITLGLEAGSLSNSENWPTGRHSDYATAVKTQNEWHTVRFIFSSAADASTPEMLVNKMIITANQGVDIPYNIYMDNIRIADEISDTILKTIVVTPSLVENVGINQTINFSEAGLDQFGNPFPTNVTWSVDGGGTINPTTGQFTANANGVWKVTAQDGNIRGTANVLVGESIHLETITLSPSSTTIYEYEQTQLSARGSDQLGRTFELTNLSWTSDNPAVATVDQNGVVTANIPGTANITASQSGVPSSVAEIIVRATPVLNSIAISPEQNTIYLDETLQFSAATLDQYNQYINVNVDWSATGGNISNGLFTPNSIGTFSVSASSGDYSAYTYVTVVNRPANIALGKLPQVSSTQGGTEPAWMTDGDPATKWSSDWLDNQWLTIDLQGEYILSGVVLNWEAAYSSVYSIEVSGDGTTWNNVYSENNGNGGIDNIALSATARHIRINLTTRGTVYGNSLYEVEVYGLPYESSTLRSIVVNPFKTTVDQNDVVNYTAQGFDQFGNAVGINPTWTANGGNMNNGSYTATQAGDFTITAAQNGVSTSASIHVNQTFVPVLTNLIISPAEITVDPNETVNYTLIGKDQLGNDYALGTVNWSSTCGSVANGVYTATDANTTCNVTATSENVSATATVHVNDYPPVGDCAVISANKPAFSSSQEGDYSATNVTDGAMNTRWSSEFNDDEYLGIDLQGTYSICEVKLYWEGAFGSDYEIRLGATNDVNAATVIATVNGGNGGEDIVTISSAATGQYIFMRGIARGTGWGYSLWEMEVIGKSGVIEDPVLTTLDINPKNSTICLGESVEFTVDGYDQFNAVYSLGTIEWTGSNGNVFTGTQLGTYTVTASSEGVSTSTTVTVIDCSTPVCNLISDGKNAFASTSLGGNVAANLTDGDMNTRWESEFNDDQFIGIDLAGTYSICEVKLFWEGAFGSDYEIRLGSTNDVNAATVLETVTGGNGGEDIITINSSLTGQYIFIKGITRGTGWGYSLWEMEVYGSDGGQILINPIANAGDDIQMQLPANSTNLNGSGTDSDGEVVDYSWALISGPNVPGISGASTTTPMISGLIAGEYVYELTVTDNDGLTGADQLIITVTPEPTNDNLLIGKPVSASSTQAGLDVAFVNDDNMGTRWGSEWIDNQWLQFDLLSEYALTNMVFEWEGAYGSNYEVLISNDASFASYDVIAAITNGTPGTVEVSTDNSKSGRYLRINLITRGTGYGFSLWEVEAYGIAGSFKAAEGSLADQSIKTDVQLYPNPVVNTLNYSIENSESEEFSIVIKDMSGRTVLSEIGTSTGSINVSELKPSSYVVIINDKNDFISKMIIKK